MLEDKIIDLALDSTITEFVENDKSTCRKRAKIQRNLHNLLINENNILFYVLK